MELVHLFPFPTVTAAIAYYRFNNPARQKAVNVLDQEPREKNVSEDFSGESPRDIWASVCRAIEAVKKASAPKEWAAFYVWHLHEDLSLTMDKAEIAERLHVDRKQVSRYIADTRDELERELIRRGLLEPIERE